MTGREIQRLRQICKWKSYNPDPDCMTFELKVVNEDVEGTNYAREWEVCIFWSVNIEDNVVIYSDPRLWFSVIHAIYDDDFPDTEQWRQDSITVPITEDESRIVLQLDSSSAFYKYEEIFDVIDRSLEREDFHENVSYEITAAGEMRLISVDEAMEEISGN